MTNNVYNVQCIKKTVLAAYRQVIYILHILVKPRVAHLTRYIAPKDDKLWIKKDTTQNMC